ATSPGLPGPVGLPFPAALPTSAGLPPSGCLPLPFPVALRTSVGLPTSADLPTFVGWPVRVGLLMLPPAFFCSEYGPPVALPTPAGLPIVVGFPVVVGLPTACPRGCETCPACALVFLGCSFFLSGGGCATATQASAKLQINTTNSFIRSSFGV